MLGIESGHPVRKAHAPAHQATISATPIAGFLNIFYMITLKSTLFWVYIWYLLNPEPPRVILKGDL